MRKWSQSPWFWPAVGIILLLILTRGQVLVAIAPLGKFLIPVIGVYAVYRLVKRKLQQSLVAKVNKTMADFARAQQQAQQNFGRHHYHQQSRPESQQPVIEICPKCGEPKKPACPDCK